MRELRDYWLPLMLFIGALGSAALLLLLVIVMPFVAVPASLPWLALFADDVTVRRTSIVGALGLIVTAVVFFRPVRKPSEPEA
jgi:hypothetical protein